MRKEGDLTLKEFFFKFIFNKLKFNFIKLKFKFNKQKFNINKFF